MILATSYFPPISYVAKFFGNDVIIDIHEHYIKQTYRNRCEILAANGSLFLSVPVSKGSLHKPCSKDILIDYSKPWQKIHWRSIESAYNNSPFFLYYKDQVEECVFSNHKFVSDLNQQILEMIFKQLQLKIDVRYSENYIDPGTDDDFRNSISPKNKSGIGFSFYQQVFSEKHGFQSDLSILDLLFNMGPDAKEYLSIITKDILS